MVLAELPGISRERCKSIYLGVMGLFGRVLARRLHSG